MVIVCNVLMHSCTVHAVGLRDVRSGAGEAFSGKGRFYLSTELLVKHARSRFTWIGLIPPGFIFTHFYISKICAGRRNPI